MGTPRRTLPGLDDETPPTPISPIASVLANIGLIESVRGAILEAVKTQQFDEVARAFVAGSSAGNAIIRNGVHDIGAAAVASAAYSALGSPVGLVNPECGGTSMETIPPTITPDRARRYFRSQGQRAAAAEAAVGRRDVVYRQGRGGPGSTRR